MVDWHRFTPSDFEYDFEQDNIGEIRGGRRLKIIFQLKAKRVVRIITGSPV